MKESKWLACIEFALVAGIFLADALHFVPLSKTPFLLLLGWVSLRLRGLRWRDVGLVNKLGWRRTIVAGVAAGLLIEGIELFVSQPLLIRLTGKQPDLSDFTSIHGHIKMLALGLLLTWTLAAFGEEMVWRGYLMNRVAGLGKFAPWAWGVSLFAVNVVFGFAHSNQGVTGIIDEGLMGVLLGVIYLKSGCNLLVPIVAHGVQDSVDVVLLYFGIYPGV